MVGRVPPSALAAGGGTSPELRPVGEHDLPALWRLAELAGHRWLRLWRGGPLDPARFATVLWQDVLALWMAECPLGPVALVGVHGADFHDGTARLELVPVIEPAHAHHLLDAVVRQVVAVVAREWGFRHLYAERLALHEPPFAGVGAAAGEVGRLPAAVWAEGDHVDLVIDDLDLSQVDAAVPVAAGVA